MERYLYFDVGASLKLKRKFNNYRRAIARRWKRSGSKNSTFEWLCQLSPAWSTAARSNLDWNKWYSKSNSEFYHIVPVTPLLGNKYLTIPCKRGLLTTQSSLREDDW